MKRKILTLNAALTKGKLSANAPQTVVAGKPNTSPSRLMLKHLQCYAELRHRVFIQMRHGAGYCGVPTQLEDGWLTMTDVSIHGTKQAASSKSILIQIRNGSLIAHLHPVNSNDKTGVQQ